MAKELRIEVDERAAMRAIGSAPGLEAALEGPTSQIVARANSLGAGYRTPKWHDHATGETRGGTQPKYGGDVRRGKKGAIGIVHPENYSAMKDNHLHNTLLKARG